MARYPSGSGSVFQIAGHPLHPMVVPLLIAGTLGALTSDVMFYGTRSSDWATLSRWLLLATLVTGALAALGGVIELMSIKRARTMRLGWAHGIAAVLLLIITFINYRARLPQPVEPILPWGLTLSALSGALVLAAGWLGGELVFKHGIGVSPGVGSEPSRTGRDDIGKA